MPYQEGEKFYFPETKPHCQQGVDSRPHVISQGDTITIEDQEIGCLLPENPDTILCEVTSPNKPSFHAQIAKVLLDKCLPERRQGTAKAINEDRAEDLRTNPNVRTRETDAQRQIAKLIKTAFTQEGIGMGKLKFSGAFTERLTSKFFKETLRRISLRLTSLLFLHIAIATDLVELFDPIEQDLISRSLEADHESGHLVSALFGNLTVQKAFLHSKLLRTRQVIFGTAGSVVAGQSIKTTRDLSKSIMTVVGGYANQTTNRIAHYGDDSRNEDLAQTWGNAREDRNTLNFWLNVFGIKVTDYNLLFAEIGEDLIPFFKDPEVKQAADILAIEITSGQGREELHPDLNQYFLERLATEGVNIKSILQKYERITDKVVAKLTQHSA